MLTAPYDHLHNTATRRPIDTATKRNNDTIAMIDYTNLYIKNLDPEVTSYDLFKRFRIFGKIISARVMKDTVTGISKGYGFVSYTHMEEANEAMQQMNGALFNTKNIVVTYHTHKKTAKHIKNRSLSNGHIDYMNLSSPPPVNASSSTTLYPMYPSQPSPPYTNSSNTNYPPFMNEPKPVTSTSSTLPSHNPWNESSGIWVHRSPVTAHHASTYATPSMHVVAPTATISTATTPITVLNDTLEHPAQFQKLRDAISNQLQEHQQKDLNDICEMIQSLKRRDLSLCLFNPSFLKQKIDEAYDALYLFENVDQQQPGLNAVELNTATQILNSLEGLTLNKKKRVFGDILYPYVRATGIRHAPKVTIRLLDTVPIEELVFNMYDKQELTRKAQLTYAQLYRIRK